MLMPYYLTEVCMCFLFGKRKMAPQAGFEPATDRLTVDSSTAELLRNAV